MTIQGLDRRSVLEMLAKAASASQFPGFSRWAYENEHKHEESSLSASRQPYTPLYFSRHQYKTIEILTDLIIPAGELRARKTPASASSLTSWPRMAKTNFDSLCSRVLGGWTQYRRRLTALCSRAYPGNSRLLYSKSLHTATRRFLSSSGDTQPWAITRAALGSKS